MSELNSCIICGFDFLGSLRSKTCGSADCVKAHKQQMQLKADQRRRNPENVDEYARYMLKERRRRALRKSDRTTNVVGSTPTVDMFEFSGDHDVDKKYEYTIAGQKLTFGVERITPEIAATYLANKAPNRVINKSSVARYSKNMLDGTWIPNGATLGFLEDGRLLDGQTRLTAVIKSGVTMDFEVIRGLSTNCLPDQGKNKNTTDHFTLNEIHNPRNVASVVPMALALSELSRPDGDPRTVYDKASTRFTPTDYISYVRRHPELHSVMARIKGLKNDRVAKCKIQLALLAFLVDKTKNPAISEDVERALHVVNTGMATYEGDPMLAFQDAVMAGRLSTNSNWNRFIIFFTLCQYFDYFRNGVKAPKRFTPAAQAIRLPGLDYSLIR